MRISDPPHRGLRIEDYGQRIGKVTENLLK